MNSEDKALPPRKQTLFSLPSNDVGCQKLLQIKSCANFPMMLFLMSDMLLVPSYRTRGAIYLELYVPWEGDPPGPCINVPTFGSVPRWVER
jgi:hypothetical protein